MLDLANFILKVKSEHNPDMDKALRLIAQDDVILLNEYLNETPNLQKQIGLSTKNGFDHIAVSAAIIDNSVSCLDFLVSKLKCCINIPEAINPIHLAAEFDDITCLDILLKNGADVNIEGPNGQLPTYYAPENAKRFLLQNKAQDSKVVTIKFKNNNEKYFALKEAAKSMNEDFTGNY